MRRRSLTHAHSPHQGVNATPLIDIVMCMIVFFLLVGKMAQDRGAAVQLPESPSGREEQAAAVIIVTVTALPAAPVATSLPSARDGGFAGIGVFVEVDGENVGNTRELESSIRTHLAADLTASIQLRADRDLSFAAIEPVLRALGNAGAKSVRFAAEKTGVGL